MSQVVRCIENGMEKDNAREIARISKPQAKPDPNQVS